MNKLIPIVALIVILTSCKKAAAPVEVTVPEKETVMLYTDLSGKILKTPNTALHIDINNDGVTDVHIQAIPVGLTDRYELQFTAAVSLGNYLSVDDNEHTAPFLLKDKITPTDMTGHHWYDVTAIVLMKNVIPAGAPYWEGNWQNLSHVYLPIMLVRKGGKYVGWIELTTNTQNGTIELYRAAISTEADKPAKAGI